MTRSRKLLVVLAGTLIVLLVPALRLASAPWLMENEISRCADEFGSANRQDVEWSWRSWDYECTK